MKVSCPQLGLQEVAVKVQSRILEEQFVCIRPQEDGGSVKDQDQTVEERVTLNTLREDGKLLYRCQGLPCDKKNQGRR